MKRPVRPGRDHASAWQVEPVPQGAQGMASRAATAYQGCSFRRQAVAARDPHPDGARRGCPALRRLAVSTRIMTRCAGGGRPGVTRASFHRSNAAGKAPGADAGSPKGRLCGPWPAGGYGSPVVWLRSRLPETPPARSGKNLLTATPTPYLHAILSRRRRAVVEASRPRRERWIFRRPRRFDGGPLCGRRLSLLPPPQTSSSPEAFSR